MGFTPSEFKIPLTQVEHDRFRLGKKPSITYTDWRNITYVLSPERINKDCTDLASVPSVLWWFVGSYGRHTRAALLHDDLVRRDDVDRHDADVIFRAALADEDVPIIRRWLMWTAVSLETTFLKRFGGRVLGGVVLAAHIALVAAATYWLSREWWWANKPWWQAGIAGIVVLTWLVWWRRAFWIPFALVLIGPPFFVVWLFRRTIGALEYAAVPIAFMLAPLAQLARKV
jgi:hypothetical protein